jgi:CheY-like chemotaxis protein
MRAEEARLGSLRTPILALTAHASQLQRDQCMTAGMDAVINKPINLPGLLRKIAAVVPSAVA